MVPRLGPKGAAYAGIGCYLVGAGGRIIAAMGIIGCRRILVSFLAFAGLITLSEVIVRQLPVLGAHAAALLSLLIALSFLLVEGRGVYGLLRTAIQNIQNRMAAT
jgi:hypothetical protein